MAHFIRVAHWTDFVTVDCDDVTLVYTSQAECDADTEGCFASAYITEAEAETTDEDCDD